MARLLVLGARASVGSEFVRLTIIRSRCCCMRSEGQRKSAHTKARALNEFHLSTFFISPPSLSLSLLANSAFTRRRRSQEKIARS